MIARDSMRTKPFSLLLTALLLSGMASAARQSAEPVDRAAIAKIRDEGLNRSQVMETAFWLTDRYGPRLTGSPEFEEAGEWVLDRLRAWGLTSVAKERFESGRGWSLVDFHATMTAPRVMPIVGMPLAWSPGLEAPVSADVVRPVIATPADFDRYRGTLRGKIVLTQSARAVRMWEHGDGAVLRYEDQDGRWLKDAMVPNVPEPADSSSTPVGPSALMTFYRTEGVVAIFDRGPSTDLAAGGSDLGWVQQRPDGGTVFVEEGPSPYSDPASSIPQIRLAVEHYNRMVRLVERGVPVRVDLNLRVRFTEESPARPNGFNIVGEIAGTEKADEVVLLGAHFDSWHGATGATDNASGSAVMMEALRILQSQGLRPRRTIRLALWGSEELGLQGSAAYVREHLGTVDAPKPLQSKLSAYFNLDNGTGPVRGVWMEGNQAVEPIFRAWGLPLEDLGVKIFSPRHVRATDHVSFHAAGIPAFQFVQDRYEYNSRTHHSTMDFYDRLQPAELRQAAVVAAVFAWHAAMRDDPLPRAGR